MMVVVLAMACHPDLSTSKEAKIVCTYQSDCPAGICSNGHCVPDPPPQLTVTSAIAVAPNAVRVTFQQEVDWTGFTGASVAVFLSDDRSKSLPVLAVRPDGSRDLVVQTGYQTPNAAYTLELYGLVGLNGEVSPPAGLSAGLIGFSPTAVLRTLQVKAPATMTSGDTVALDVSVFNPDLSLFKDMYGDLAVSTSGAGTVELLQSPGWNLGSQRLMVRYTRAKDTPGEQESVTFTVASSAYPGLSGTSGPVAVKRLAALGTLKVEAPAAVAVDAPMAVAVTALDELGAVMTDFSGPVTLSAEVAPSLLTVDGWTPFSAGVATATVRFAAVTDRLYVQATHAGATRVVGVSGRINVGLDSSDVSGFLPVAVPLADTTSASAVRLTWNALPDVTSVVVDRDQGGTWVPLHTVAAPVAQDVDSGPGLPSQVKYRLTAYNAANPVAIGFAEATLKTCHPLFETAIGQPTLLAAADSPYCVPNPQTYTARLLVEPGVIVLFSAGAGWTFGQGGELVARGTHDAPIVLTSLAASWSGISDPSGVSLTFDGAGGIVAGSELEHVIVENVDGNSYFNRGLSLRDSCVRGCGASPCGFPVFSFGGIDPVQISRSSGNRNACTLFDFDNAVIRLERRTVDRSVFVLNESPPLYTQGGLTLSNSLFVRNSGGALKVQGSVAPLVRHNTFLRNVASGEGGAVSASGGSFLDNVFVGNAARGPGGAIYCQGCAEVSHNLFRSNRSDAAGGALFALASPTGTLIDANLFDQNTSALGGALYLGAAAGNSSETVSRNVFGANTAYDQGSNLYNQYCAPTFSLNYWSTSFYGTQDLSVFGIANFCSAGIDLNGSLTDPLAACGSAPTAADCVGPR